MKLQGKTIQIYCPAGEPRGVRIAEITTRIVQAIVVPRAKLDEALARLELQGVGAYYLFGESTNTGAPRVYIGEAESLIERLKEHHRLKEFWNTAVVIASRTGSFTKAHIRLLEWLSIGKAREIGRYELDNANSGIEPSVPEWMRSDVEEVFDTTDVLLSTLGYPLFEPTARLKGPGREHVFFCRRSGADARGVYNEDGLVVLAGSIVRTELTPSAREMLEAKRKRLLDEGVLARDDGILKFCRDHPFSSPSAASDMVCGASTNGWEEWRDEAGRTLDGVYRSGTVAISALG
jgi:hypothetical protein